jgi:hypothetical protein
MEMQMRWRSGLTAAALAGLSLGWALDAQERPDFTGIWAVVAEQTPLMGAQFSVRHSASELTIVRPWAGSEMVMRIPLDGTEARVRVPARRLCEGDSVSTYGAGWDGGALRLSLSSVIPPGGGEPTKRDSHYTLTISAPDTLTMQLQNAAAGGAPARVITTVYKRTGNPAAAPPATPAPTPATIAQIGWLTGLWVAERGSARTEERWTSAASGAMLALSRTLRGTLMTEFEFLCIVEREGGLVYVAMPNGRQPPTDFVLTRIDADGATFENPAHDFPKMIRYTRTGEGLLEATISGEGGQKPITFSFRKHE